MYVFGVEVVLSAIVNGDLALLYKVLDEVPGTILIEDIEQPILLFTIYEMTAAAAVRAALDAAALSSFAIISVHMINEPETEYDQDFDPQEYIRKPRWWRPLPRRRWPAWVPGSTCRGN